MTTPKRWAQWKTASWSRDPAASARPEGYGDWHAQRLLNQYFPYREGVRTVRESQGLTLQDKMELLTAMNTAASGDQGTPQPSVRLGDFLPEAAGAGLGLMGAALIAPLFSMSPKQKTLFGIGSAALGAVLNTVGRR